MRRTGALLALRPGMSILRNALAAGFALALAACAAPVGPARPGPANTFPGFDLQRYPGEAAMRAWRASSPYVWVGYYLPAPCSRGTSWVGTRPTLERLGWGTAVLYVGQQLFETDTVPGSTTGGPVVCSRTLLTAERGRADAADAIARAQSEGFPAGSTVFLDVERMSRVPPEMAAYYGAWTDAVLRDRRYVPGTYAHRENTSALYALAQAAWAGAGRAGTPPFWVAGGAGFSLEQRPFASGFPYAVAWQGVLDADRSWGGVALRVDENVASRPSPSAP